MTEQTTTTDQTSGGGNIPDLSGVDLARVALQQARLAARNNGGREARAPGRRQPTAVKRDGWKPSGLAAVLAGLRADRAWEAPGRRRQHPGPLARHRRGRHPATAPPRRGCRVPPGNRAA